MRPSREMQLFFFYYAALASLLYLSITHVSAAVHPRSAISDPCSVPEVGNGICGLKHNCWGVFVEDNVCDVEGGLVQCCITIPCGPIETRDSGLCVSIFDNECSDGEFTPNACPGDADIQCCVPKTVTTTTITPATNSSSPTTAPTLAMRAEDDNCSPTAADNLIFDTLLSSFLNLRDSEYPSCFDWSSDGCTCAPDSIDDFDFLPACQRHDFGYRNAEAMGRFDEEYKGMVDRQFRVDLHGICEGEEDGEECRLVADLYVEVVESVELRRMRGRRDGVVGLGRRDCDVLSGIF